MDKILFYAVPAMGVLGLLYTLVKFNWVSKQDAGNDRMKEISTYIAEGAMAFLKAEYKILGYFVVVVALLLGVMGYSDPNSHWSIAVAFVFGAFFSALAGFIGMRVATKANVRTAQAARTSLKQGAQSFFYRWIGNGNGCCRIGRTRIRRTLYILKMIFAPHAAVDSEEMKRTIEVLTGFSSWCGKYRVVCTCWWRYLYQGRGCRRRPRW
jgi:K(+)-stimulated pyrophosphate-energized sodium pump